MIHELSNPEPPIDKIWQRNTLKHLPVVLLSLSPDRHLIFLDRLDGAIDSKLSYSIYCNEIRNY